VPTPETTVVKQVVVRGRSLAVAQAGAGRDVLLVHGNFASLRWFGPLLQEPPAGLRVTALDLPGFGRSDALGGPISIGAYADAVRDAIAALALERPVLLGHSLGGSVAMAAAASAPDAFAGLVLVSSAAPHGLVTPEATYPFLESFRTNRAGLHAALAAMIPTRLPPDFDALVDDAMAMHPEGFSGNARALARLHEPAHDLTPRLEGFTGPVLVVRGGLDALVTADMAAATVAAFGHGPVTLETWNDVGHSPVLESPDRFRARLAAFVAALPLRGGGGAMR
jgi:branched-chain amino acid transport system permease protein